MAIHKIDDINKFIRFLMDLYNDEFDYTIDYLPACYYFNCGGCYELAQIVNHYFPHTKFAVNKTFEHVAIFDGDVIDGKLVNGNLYDSYTPYTEEELNKLNIVKTKLNLDDFTVYSKEEIDNFETSFGRNIKIEGKNVVNGLLDELNNISTIKIGK